MRRCTKTGCQGEAQATLTYNYADSQVVVGPLAQRAEPHVYDLCLDHARRITAPRGWEVLRLDLPAPSPAASSQVVAASAPPRPPEDPEPGRGLRVLRGGL